jgi:erythritol kinase
MDACVAEWVTPLLGPPEAVDPELVKVYDRLFPAYLASRRGLVAAWDLLASARRETSQ